jgi:hypothetical protein
MAPIIQILEETIGLGKTIFVLSAAVFSAIIFALMYKMPKKVVKVEKRTLAKSTSLLGFPTVEYKTSDKTEKDIQVRAGLPAFTGGFTKMQFWDPFGACGKLRGFFVWKSQKSVME